MNRQRFRRLAMVALAVSIVAAGVTAQPAEDEEAPPWWQGGTGGIVFNYAGSSINLESYQGGLGFKLQKAEIGHRIHADAFFALDSNIIDLGIGYTRERHLHSGIAEPYLGFTVRTQIVRRRNELGGDSWQSTISIPLAVGPVLGVELRPTEFLGIFAEYELIASASAEITRSSEGGTDTQFDAFADAAMGNNGRIGLVVYFPLDFLARDRADSEQ